MSVDGQRPSSRPRSAAAITAGVVLLFGLTPVVLVTIAARSGSLGSFDDPPFAALATVAATVGAAVAFVAVRGLARRVALDPVGDTSAVWGAAAAGVGVHALGQTLVPVVILATIGLSEDESVQPAMGAIEAAWVLGQLTSIGVALTVGRLVAGPVAERRRPTADSPGSWPPGEATGSLDP